MTTNAGGVLIHNKTLEAACLQGLRLVAAALYVTNTQIRNKENKQYTSNYKGVQNVANNQNLKPLNTRSERERKEIARMGAAASNRVQAEKKALREAAKLILSLPVDGKTRKILKSYGVPDDEQSYAMAMVIGQVKAAINGSSPAFNAIRDVAGESPNAKEEVKDDDREIVINIVPASRKPLEEQEEEF